MLDIKAIREKPDVIRHDLKKRGDTEKLGLFEDLLEKDRVLRQKIGAVENEKARKNEISFEIAKLRKANKPFDDKLKEMKDLDEKIKKGEDEIKELQARCNFIIMRLPNILHSSVPVGKDENDNVEMRKWGKIQKFKFKPRGHEEIAAGIDGVDIERAAKISGARLFFLKNELALLDLALQRFAIDFLMRKKFKLLEPPALMHRTPYEGVTDLSDFETMMYKIDNEDLYLIATSEHPMIAMWKDEIIAEKALPLRFVGFSPCFRKEAGTHGKDTKGIFRVHQFNKVEQIIICKPQDSLKLHEELIANTEGLFKALKLPYRVVNVCTGDIGTVAAKKYDVEAWMPAQQRYREVASCSNVTDYQARRLNIRYGKPGAPNQPFVHTLNDTAIATSRAIVAILENYQQKDGSVKIPQVLWKYMNGIKVIKPKKKKQ